MEKVNHMIHFDFINTRKTVIWLLGFYFVFGLYYGFCIGNLSVIPVTIMLWVSTIVGLPFVFRDKYNLDYLIGTFPVNRKCNIIARFLYALIIGAFGISLSEIMLCILSGFFRIGFDRKVIYFSLCVSVLLFILIISIHLPLCFISSKSQVIVISPLFIYILYTLVFMLYYSNSVDVDMTSIINIFWKNIGFSVIGLLLIAVLLLAASYHITYKLYENKDL